MKTLFCSHVQYLAEVSFHVLPDQMVATGIILDMTKKLYTCSLIFVDISQNEVDVNKKLFLAVDWLVA